MILWPFPESAPNWNCRCQKRPISLNIKTVTEIFKIGNQEVARERAEQNNGEINTVINTKKLKWIKGAMSITVQLPMQPTTVL